MKKVVSLIVSIGFGALAMTSVSVAGDDRKDVDDGPDPRIGAEVNRICFQRNINGWRALKGEDDVILLERGVNNWYRVELMGMCDYRVLRSAISIGIDSRPGGGCVSRGDHIIVEDGPGFNRRCSITQINEWDEDALKEETESEEE